MKQSIRFLTILATGIFMIASVVSADVTLSNPASIPTSDVAIAQSNTTGTTSIQARNRAANSSDWRVITQTFTWNSKKKMSGLGLYFHSDQNSWTSDQEYQLVIQALNGNTPTLDVANITFDLDTAHVGASQWLYIDFDDISLVDGATYGFSFGPSASGVNGAQRSYWTTANGDVYSGIARQYNPNPNGIPKTDSYSSGGSVNDYAFYMTTKPDDVILSNPLDAPTGNNVVITQYVTGGTVIQARRTGGFRGITQTFWWPTDKPLDKIGLYLNNNSGNDWASDMLYVLCIQALNGNTPTSTIAELEFSLDAAHMGAAQWIQFDLKQNLSLNSNQWYGFTLSPVERETASLRSYWETGSSSYPGRGGQNDPSSDGIPKTTDYGSAGIDFTMYFTVPIPEPATIALFGFGFLALSLRKTIS